MRFYTKQHRFYCGIDLHAKMMYVCILSSEGKTIVERNIPTNPERFLKLIQPYREEIVIGVECMFSWYWLADMCAQEEIPFVLGHALYMKAVSGGKAQNDRLDAQKIAAVLFVTTSWTKSGESSPPAPNLRQVLAMTTLSRLRDDPTKFRPQHRLLLEAGIELRKMSVFITRCN